TIFSRDWSSDVCSSDLSNINPARSFPASALYFCPCSAEINEVLNHFLLIEKYVIGELDHYIPSIRSIKEDKRSLASSSHVTKLNPRTTSCWESKKSGVTTIKVITIKIEHMTCSVARQSLLIIPASPLFISLPIVVS